MNGNYSNRNLSNGNHSNRKSSNESRSNRNSLIGNLLNGNHSNGNLSNGNYLNGNLSNGNLLNGNHSNGNISNGNHSNGNISNENISNGNISNGSSHSSAPQIDWKNLFQIRKTWLEKCQAELQDSQLKCLQVQEQYRELRESYKELRVAWQNLRTELEKDWQLRAETARAYQEFQTAYEEERKQRVPVEQAQELFHDKLQRGLQLLIETAQKTARDSNRSNFHLDRDPFEHSTQLAMPNQSLPLRSTLNPVAPVFSKPRKDTRPQSADSAYYSSSSKEAANGSEPKMSNGSGTASSGDANSPSTPSTPPNPSQIQFGIPQMLPKFPRRHKSDSCLTDMRAGKASTPE
ncbi:uncharacterized protein EAE98_008425 [Botrytis deweyae]|uniref:Uncharacterized protein n=1 Tax=Botrytis deweyae TaxID=2478750 RepID=A0ABQ7IE65_9HELO|nr:uncharacterized protein EAE98_008425 [Botrytis deweyae]KAF7921578.1 hypothetical protein EAE98_008425 [Botrytis deweyae]